jgi:hypothetical protein
MSFRDADSVGRYCTVHARERRGLGRPMADDDLPLSRADGTRLPVRDYSREFAAQRKAAGLKAIPLGKLRHSNISRMRAAGVAADVVAAWHGHTERMTQPSRLKVVAGIGARGEGSRLRPTDYEPLAADTRPPTRCRACTLSGPEM